MARYIDAERFDVVTFQGVSEDFIDGMDYILDMIDKAPTEDVVPRSEVEEIVKFKDMAYAELKSLFIEAKQEVAREIFELIDCAFSPVFDYNGYTIKEYIAEIKKKYIGE